MRSAAGLFADISGATAIEYGLIVCLIALAAMGSTNLVGNALSSTLFIASNTMTNAPAIAGKS